jgi:hypothetical protein
MKLFNIKKVLKDKNISKDHQNSGTKSVILKKHKKDFVYRLQNVHIFEKPNQREYFIRKQIPLPTLGQLAMIHEKEMRKIP